MVHFASDEAGEPADSTAAPRRQLHGLALRSSIAGRMSNAGSASPSPSESPEPGQRPSQEIMNSSDGSLPAGVESGVCTEQSESIEREPEQLLASAAAEHTSTAVSSPRGEAWTLGLTGTVPRRLPPLTVSRQGPAGPTPLLSGNWVSCRADTETDSDWVVSVLLSRSFVCGEASQHVALPVVDMANHGLQPTATVKCALLALCRMWAVLTVACPQGS